MENRIECIVHYELIRDTKISPLRGMIEVEPGVKPTVNQLIDMFNKTDLHVVAEDASRNLFRSTTPGDSFKIRVKKFDMGDKQDDYVEDTNLKAILSNLLPRNPTL